MREELQTPRRLFKPSCIVNAEPSGRHFGSWSRDPKPSCLQLPNLHNQLVSSKEARFNLLRSGIVCPAFPPTVTIFQLLTPLWPTYPSASRQPWLVGFHCPRRQTKSWLLGAMGIIYSHLGTSSYSEKFVSLFQPFFFFCCGCGCGCCCCPTLLVLLGAIL